MPALGLARAVAAHVRLRRRTRRHAHGQRVREDVARLTPSLEPRLLADGEELVSRLVVAHRHRATGQDRAGDLHPVRVDRCVDPRLRAGARAGQRQAQRRILARHRALDAEVLRDRDAEYHAALALEVQALGRVRRRPLPRATPR